MQCLKMIFVKHGENVHKVPCGKCAFCLTNKRSQWMFRIHHEMRVQEHPGYFLTLTYDEKHVRRVDDGRLSLRFRDIQLYIKRIRKAKHYVKYVCVGEYGGITHRPHYHMLLWTDATPDFLQANWKSSKDDSILGSIHFGALSMQSAMYTLKYIIQPKQHLETVYDCFGAAVDTIEKTRAQFSKGLGLGYLTSEVYEYHTFDYDNPVMFSYIDGKKVALPRYYRSKIFTKYQMGEQRRLTKNQVIKERFKTYRSLRAKGIRGIRSRLQRLRTENAEKIMNRTKHNLSL